MSDLTVRTWVDQEKRSFDNFKQPLAVLFEEALIKSIAETLRRNLRKSGESRLALPFGIFFASVKAKGETGNITPGFEPPKGFLKALNSESDDSLSSSSAFYQDEFDPLFFKLFKDYVAYGFFDPDAPENKDKVVQKGVKLSDDEAAYFVNGYAQVLTTIAKDKQREGKLFRLEIDATYPFGIYTFEYDDNEIGVTFTFNKVFKQALKDDDVASVAAQANFTVITENETRMEEIDVNDPRYQHVNEVFHDYDVAHMKRN